MTNPTTQPPICPPGSSRERSGSSVAPTPWATGSIASNVRSHSGITDTLKLR